MNGLERGLISSYIYIKEESRQIFQIDKTKVKQWEDDIETKIKYQKAKEEEKNKEIENIETHYIPKKEAKINQLEEALRELSKPKKDLPESSEVNKVVLIIGITILIGLTLYLLIFYSSAAYSALLKKYVVDDIAVSNSIFDPYALVSAYEESWGSLLLIISITCVFMGLGYLIHLFQSMKVASYKLKIAALILITFLFDFILAYEITKKLYDLRVQNSFDDLPKYTILMALENINFWLIIFAGFVAYIIWGMLFDFVMIFVEKLNVIRHKNLVIKREINQLQAKINNHRSEAEKLSGMALKFNNKSEELKAQLGKGIYIGSQKYAEGLIKNILSCWRGWQHWMTANKIHPSEIEKCQKITDEFLEKINKGDTTIKEF